MAIEDIKLVSTDEVSYKPIHYGNGEIVWNFKFSRPITLAELILCQKNDLIPCINGYKWASEKPSWWEDYLIPTIVEEPSETWQIKRVLAYTD